MLPRVQVSVDKKDFVFFGYESGSIHYVDEQKVEIAPHSVPIFVFLSVPNITTEVECLECLPPRILCSWGS